MKSEGMAKDAHRITNGATGAPVVHCVRHSGFPRASLFWFRQFPLLLACTAVAHSLPEVDDIEVPPVAWDWTRGRGLPEGIREKFAVLVPPGHAHTGLRYPVYNRRQADTPLRLEAELNAARVERVMDELVQLDGVDFASYGDEEEPGKITRTLRMTRAWLDLACEFLFTTQPVEIADDEHLIRSGEMLHDRASGLTIFSGRVNIYFTGEETPATLSAAPNTAAGAKKP